MVTLWFGLVALYLLYFVLYVVCIQKLEQLFQWNYSVLYYYSTFNGRFRVSIRWIIYSKQNQKPLFREFEYRFQNKDSPVSRAIENETWHSLNLRLKRQCSVPR